MVARAKVLLDTNFLLTMVRYKIRGLEELQEKGFSDLYTMSGVIGEIEALSKGNKKIKNEAAIVKQILKNNNVRILESTNPNIDADLLEKSAEYVIATNDKALRDKIKAKGGKTVFIRSLTFIETKEAE